MTDPRPFYGPPRPVEYAGGMDWCDPQRPVLPVRKRRDLAPFGNRVRRLTGR